MSGTTSIILGTLLIRRALFEKKVVVNNKKRQNYIIGDESLNDKIVKDSKIKGYTIFKNSIDNYLKNESEPSFSNFMKKEWPSDFNIYNEKDSTKTRSYKNWEKIYNAVLNGEKNIENIIILGEEKNSQSLEK